LIKSNSAVYPNSCTLVRERGQEQGREHGQGWDWGQGREQGRGQVAMSSRKLRRNLLVLDRFGIKSKQL